MTQPEYEYSELPTIEELKTLGWEFIEGDTSVPEFTERDNFKEVVLINRLKESVKNINRDDNGEIWLDNSQVSLVVNTLLNTSGNGLIDSNKKIFELLYSGITIQGKDGKQQTIQYIDFNNPSNNNFLAINQFRVNPISSKQDRGYIIPDIVLFVNSIPLVIIECKSPTLNNPLEKGISDLLKYSNQRETEEAEGVERLFYYNLLMIAMSQNQAVAGAVGYSYSNYVQWKDTTPYKKEEIAQQFGVEELNSRQMLITGMLSPANLLDIFYNFTVFETVNGKIEKRTPRYQQFRVIYKAIDRLKNNKTKQKHGLEDQRGGIIWHTQGAGKSLTMVFLIRKIRTIPELRKFKIVVVTDRKDLEKQLLDTADSVGEPLKKAKTVKDLEALLRQEGAGFVFAMIQKFKANEGEEEDNDNFKIEANLNVSEHILVLVDEAHRSHGNTLHANLLKALPNCVRIGFTGTPIVKDKKKKTTEIFGSFIDKYSIRESQEDGVTLPILYEGVESRIKVKNGDEIDQIFELIFADKTEEEKLAIKTKYVTKASLGEAEEVIKAKAWSMLLHYVTHILPNGFKAQVVASSRKAAVLYQEAFCEAKDKLIQSLKAKKIIFANLDTEAIQTLATEEMQCLARADQYLALIETLDFATVVSGSKEDPKSWEVWTDESRHDVYTERFKKPVTEDGLCFLIVQKMLITGFNAPIEQVMYLDRSIKEHELLQAIARVNRTKSKKEYGLIVDYYGVDLISALEMYDKEDLKGAYFDIKEELPKLRDSYYRVINIFNSRDLSIEDEESCVNLLKDEKLRVQFDKELKEFLSNLDKILPRPEALEYVKGAKHLGLIKKLTADVYRDEQLSIIDTKDKISALINEYLISEEISTKIEPVDILSVQFEEELGRKYRSPRTRASAMEHTIRKSISISLEDDPVFYRRLSEQLEEILKKYSKDWEAQINAMKEIQNSLNKGRQEDKTGLNPKIERPFLSILEQYCQEDLEIQIKAIKEIVEHIRQELKKVKFWRKKVAQEELRKWIIQYLDDENIVEFNKLAKIADEFIQLARRKNDILVNGDT